MGRKVKATPGAGQEKESIIKIIAILTSDRIDFKAKDIIRNKEGHY